MKEENFLLVYRVPHVRTNHLGGIGILGLTGLLGRISTVFYLCKVTSSFLFEVNTILKF